MEIIRVVTNDVVDRFVAIAERWDPEALQREVSLAIDGLDEAQRPFVPINLAKALGMFLDSYGQRAARWNEEP